MWGLDTLRRINEEASAAHRASLIASGREIAPVEIVSQKQRDDLEIQNLPILGWDEVIGGFERTDSLFVDSSGMGAENEPALTWRQFLSRVEVGKAYAICEVGQFQCHIGVYVKQGDE